ncbi:MAG: hypothetical protein ABJF23_02715 [Bryobacteraceae bacterium]
MRRKIQPLLLSGRTALAEKILAAKQQVAEAVTAEFFVRHPDWLTRYGERGRARGVEDAIYHQRYLASAIEAGAAAPFADYARWTVNMLGARNIAAVFVAENLEQIRQEVEPLLSPDEHELVSVYIRGACDSIDGTAPQCPVETPSEPQTELRWLVVFMWWLPSRAIAGERRT